MTRSRTAGIHLDVAAAEYFEDPCPDPSLTQSIAKILLERSPRHAWVAHPRLNTQIEAAEEGYDGPRAIGSAAHALMLGRGRRVHRLEFENFRTKAAQERRDEILAAGEVPLLPHHADRVQDMVEAAREQLSRRHIGPIWQACDSEVVVITQVDGAWCRSMIDLLSADHRFVLDYKTGGFNAAPHAIARKMLQDGVHIQAAFHEMVLDALEPDDAGKREHWFAFQENTEPYAMTAFALSEEWMTMGRKEVARALAQWSECLNNNKWPLYPIGAPCPPFPSWEMQRMLTAEETAFQESKTERPADFLMGG